MPSALRFAAHTPAHARPVVDDTVSEKRSRSWRPVLVIACIYAVIIGVSEWRLQRHVDSVRNDSGVVTEVDQLPAE